MNHAIRAAMLLLALTLIAQAPALADSDKEGDWAGGWNTWKTSVKGDWVETSMDGGIRTRWEVVKVDGGKISYCKKTFQGEKETSKKELTKDWSVLPLTVKLPYSKDAKVAWTVEELDLSGVKLSCDVAKWTIGEATTSAYYCKDVPCGGFVKCINNGADIVWLSSFHTEKSGDVKEDPNARKEPIVDVKSQLPRFFAGQDNSAIIKISGTGRDATWQLRSITLIAETSTQYSAVTCDEAGIPIEGAKVGENEQTKADWDKLYAKPSETGIKLTVAAGEFVCDVFKRTADGKETTEWISEGAPIKKVIKSGETETVMEAVKITMK